MKRLLVISVLLLTLLIGKPVNSADYQKGQDAAIRSDFATALKELLPLAQQGHFHAQCEIAPQLTFPRDRDFDATPGIYAGFEIRFGG